MKKNEIDQEIRAHFKKIEKLFPEVMAHLSIKEISLFRQEIKHLKAFLHMLDMENRGNDMLRVPKQLKAFNGYTSIIRSIKITLDNIGHISEGHTDPDYSGFVNKLEGDIIYWKNMIREFIGNGYTFYDDEISIRTLLPDKLVKKSIRKFVEYNLYEIGKSLRRINDDDILCDLCRYLQDLLYNWNYIAKFQKIMPEGISDEVEIKTLVDDLSIFIDKTTSCTLLQSYYDELGTITEKAKLEKLVTVFNAEKESIKSAIGSKLELIPVKPVIKKKMVAG